MFSFACIELYSLSTQTLHFFKHLISSHQVKANVKHVQQLPASSVKVLRRPDDKTFVRKKKAPWEINLDPNAEQYGGESPQIQMKLEPEVQLDEEEGSEEEREDPFTNVGTPMDKKAEDEFYQNLANSQRITPAGLREMEVKVH